MKQQLNTPDDENILSLAFSGSIPQAYDEYLSPFIFNPFAKDLAAFMPALPQQQVLELACGTGCYTQELVRHLPADNAVVATDVSVDMLNLVYNKVQAQNLSWDLCDISQIFFQPNTFNVVTSQFGLMFLKDKLAAFSDIRRVLKPVGAFIFNVWDSPLYNKIWHTTGSVVSGMIGPAPTSFNATGPFSMSDSSIVLAMLQEAGFSEIEQYTQKLNVSSTDALTAAKGFVYGLPFRDVISKIYPDKIEAIVLRLHQEFISLFGDNPLQTQMQAGIYKAIK